jgi:hypothetical protein
MLPIVRGFYKEPKFKGLLLRRTFPELESEIILRSREWYKLTGAKYNEERKRWVFPSGAVMQFGHAEFEEDVRKYDTSEYNYIAFDELTSFTEFQYTYLSKTRCRSSSNRLPAIVRSATNPGNISHAFVRDYFVNPAPYGTIIIDKITKLKRIFIQAFAEDNPYLMDNDPGYVSRLESLPEAEKQAKRYGHWDTFEGQVFDDYREIPNTLKNEPENACHLVREPFQIPDFWLRFLSIDWGFSAMTIALWGALDPKDRLYIYREYSIKGARTSTWATDIGRLSQGEKYADIVLCASAWQNRGEQLTQQEQFTKYSSLTARRADNDRIAGKLLVQEYLRWKDKPKSRVVRDSFDHDLAARILRLSGTDAYKSYLASFEEEKKEEHLPKLQIFPDCKELRKCLPLCIYDKKSNSTNKPAEDVREFDGDDPYDTLRYLICSVDKYLGTLKAEGDKRDRVSQILEKFGRTQDYNYLYRAMERTERIEDSEVPVRRFHRARV